MDHTRRFFLFAQAFTLGLLALNIALAWLIPALLEGTAWNQMVQFLLTLVRTFTG